MNWLALRLSISEQRMEWDAFGDTRSSTSEGMFEHFAPEYPINMPAHLIILEFPAW